MISVEVFCRTRRDFKPNPQIDPVDAIFFTICNDATKTNAPENPTIHSGIFVVDCNQSLQQQQKCQLFDRAGISVSNLNTFQQEKAMFLEFSLFIQKLDPDIIVGYEVQMLSWGYLIERGALLDLDMCHLFSRIVDKDTIPRSSAKSTSSDMGYGQSMNMTITGRIILNVWRVMRSEVTS